MARTFSALIFYNPSAYIGFQTAGTVAQTRNAAGDFSTNISASSTATIDAGVELYKRPTGLQMPAFPGQGTVLLSNEFQEAFGTTPATPGAAGPGNPFSGSSTSTQFGTPAVPWGLAIVDVFAVYSVGTNPLTTATVALYRQRYVENVAFAQDIVLAPTATSLAVTASATTCHVQKVSLAQPLVFEATDNSDLVIEAVFTTPAGGTARIYGVGIHVAAEFS
jgi:hypothetical protein